MVGPMAAATVVVFLRLDRLGWIISLCTATLSWMPILNPVITIYFVETYRKIVWNVAHQTAARLPKWMQFDLKPKMRSRNTTVSTVSTATVVSTISTTTVVLHT